MEGREDCVTNSVDQPTGKAPCRECGQVEWHDAAIRCTFIGSTSDEVTSPVLDSERVASGEGSVKFSKHTGGAYADMEGVVKSELAKVRTDRSEGRF